MDLQMPVTSNLESVIRDVLKNESEITIQLTIERIDDWICSKFQIELMNAAQEGPLTEEICLRIWHRFKKDLKLNPFSR